jgi:ComF family protein
VTPLTRAISLWKYENERYLSEILAELLSEWVACRAPRWWEKIEAVCPVPHHPKSVRARGFSPSEELAKSVAHRFGLPCLSRTVFKTRFTPRQAGLDRARRLLNLRMSMSVFDPPMVDGKTVLVIDDVITTGATIDECARALMVAGADKVYGLTLARQSLGNSHS